MNLALRNVSKSYDGQTVIDGFDFELAESHCLALIGPSGGGKSTTLRLIAGLERPDSGSIQVNQHALQATESELRAYRKTIGIVFQAYNLFPHLDALANIALPLQLVHRLDERGARQRARDLLDRFQLSEHAHKKPAELSGGQNQRVAIARALAPDPEILMLDEPTSALDPEMTAEVMEAIEQLVQDGKDVIIVTHQMGFAKRAADHVCVIADGQAIETAPSSQLFHNPKNPLTQRFLSKILKY